MGIAVWRVVINTKNRSILGGCQFSPNKKKSVPFQRSSGLVVIRRVARLSRIGARLMFGHPGHATASPRAIRVIPGLRRAPMAVRRPAGGPVRLIFIGGPRLGRPAAPIGAAKATCLCSHTLFLMSEGLSCVSSVMHQQLSTDWTSLKLG